MQEKPNQKRKNNRLTERKPETRVRAYVITLNESNKVEIIKT